MSKNRTHAAWERIHAMRAKLAELFPAAIMVKDGPDKRPLKLGIYHDIRALTLNTLDQREVSAALSVYCSSKKYLSTLVEGAIRIDLLGQPAGVVDAKAAADAVRALHKQANPPADLALDARRYRYLRSRPEDTIGKGGVFAGKTPENLILTEEDLDRHVDAAMAAEAAHG